jgi:hypothetical protein
MSYFPNAIVLTGLVICAPPCFAANDNYKEPLQSYAGELKRDDLEVLNGSFIGAIATSQAKRSLLISGPDNLYQVDGSRDSPVAAKAGSQSGVSVASPQIFGNVRGNVNIVVQRGAIRGNITSVKR